jgi:hypothetical protein
MQKGSTLKVMEEFIIQSKQNSFYKCCPGTFGYTHVHATQKQTAIDQQQHSCEMLIYQRHQTILRLLSSAAMASTRWSVPNVIVSPRTLLSHKVNDYWLCDEQII